MALSDIISGVNDTVSAGFNTLNDAAGALSGTVNSLTGLISPNNTTTTTTPANNVSNSASVPVVLASDTTQKYLFLGVAFLAALLILKK